MNNQIELTRMVEHWLVSIGQKEHVLRIEDFFGFRLNIERKNRYLVLGIWAEEDGVYVQAEVRPPIILEGQRLEAAEHYCDLVNADRDWCSGAYLVSKGRVFFRDHYLLEDGKLPTDKELKHFFLGCFLMTCEFTPGVVDVLDGGLSPEEAIEISRREFVDWMTARFEKQLKQEPSETQQ